MAIPSSPDFASDAPAWQAIRKVQEWLSGSQESGVVFFGVSLLPSVYVAGYIAVFQGV